MRFFAALFSALFFLSTPVEAGVFYPVIPTQSAGDYLRSNSGVNRGVIPPAIASAPTITQFTSTQFASGLSVAYNDARLLTTNANWFQVGANPRAKPITACTDGVVGCNAASTNIEGNSGSIFFNSDCATCEIQGLYSLYHIYVDQHDGNGWVDLGVQSSGNSGTMFFLDVAFGSSKARSWRIDCDISCQFAAINALKTATIWAYVPPNPQSAILVGDSFCEGTGATNVAMESYVNRLGFKLGLDLMYASCAGGTGFQQPNAPRVNYAGRIASLIAATACPTFYLLQNSENDDPFTAAQVETNEQSVINSIKSSCPKSFIILLGLWNTSGTNPTAAALNTALASWAATNGYTWIDNYTWITGTGNTTTPTGDGNADFYVSGPATPHPTTAGHTYRAYRFGDSLRNIFYPLLP